MKSRAEYEAEAEVLIRDKLSRHPDEGVRAINALCSPPTDTIARVADALEKRDATVQ